MAFYEVVLVGQQNADEMLTVLHYEITGNQPNEWQSFANAISLLMIGSLDGALATTVRYTGIRVREDIPGGVGFELGFTGGDVVGGSAGPDLVFTNCMIIRKQASGLVRPTQGRVYQGGLPATFVGSTGFWDTTFAQTVEDFWTSMINITFGAAGVAQMVIKARNPSAPNTQPYSEVESMVRLLNPGTQRRRRIGVGN